MYCFPSSALLLLYCFPSSALLLLYCFPSLAVAQFSLRYAEFVLGGRLSRKVLERLVVCIITAKGSMPVGEIGKNIQSMTGCENLSKKLKEQFSGLKKAMETLK